MLQGIERSETIKKLSPPADTELRKLGKSGMSTVFVGEADTPALEIARAIQVSSRPSSAVISPRSAEPSSISIIALSGIVHEQAAELGRPAIRSGSHIPENFDREATWFNVDQPPVSLFVPRNTGIL
jgi:hypothetical protein